MYISHLQTPHMSRLLVDLRKSKIFVRIGTRPFLLLTGVLMYTARLEEDRSTLNKPYSVDSVTKNMLREPVDRNLNALRPLCLVNTKDRRELLAVITRIRVSRFYV